MGAVIMVIRELFLQMLHSKSGNLRLVFGKGKAILQQKEANDEVRLRELELFSREKRQILGDLRAAFQ